MASICNYGNGLAIRWREGGRGGEMKTDPRRFERNAQGRAAAALALKEIERAMLIRGPVALGMTLAVDEVGQRYKRDRLAEGKHTIGEAVTTWDRVCKERGWKTIANITHGEVQAWRTDGAPNGAMKIVGAVLRWARDFADQSVENKTLVSLRPRDRKRKPLDPLLTDVEMEDIQAKADGIGPATGAMVYCLSVYGWRSITAGRVLVGDVHLDTVPPTIDTEVKSGDRVRHPINPETVRRLRPLVADRAPEEHLWLNSIRADRPGTKGSEVRAFDERGTHSVVQYLDRAVTPRTYRIKRLAITRMAKSGASLAEIALFTGHRDLDVLLVYLRTNLADAVHALARLESEAGKAVVQIHPNSGIRCAPVVNQPEQAEQPGKSNVNIHGNIIQFTQFRAASR